MWLIVGLGNPGSKYERNRHNIGFRVVDELLSKHSLPAAKGGKHGGDVSQGMLRAGGNHKVVVLKPMEYMNNSGFAVQRVSAFHHVPVENIVVVHDEIDLDFGVVRIKVGGGHGGNNGVRSMIDQLGDNGFVRIRIGVGKPGPAAGASPEQLAAAKAASGDKNVAGWVLGDFPAAQAEAVDRVIRFGCECIESVVSDGAKPAMNRHNGEKSLA